MVKHIVLWNFLPELSVEQKKEAGEAIKRDLTQLKEHIKGILELDVIINELESSNKEIALISAFETIEDLNAYQIHPEHVKAASFIRNVTCDRACLDYKN